jgi:hypothetical protein
MPLITKVKADAASKSLAKWRRRYAATGGGVDEVSHQIAKERVAFWTERVNMLEDALVKEAIAQELDR